jgi:hypothetical protein
MVAEVVSSILSKHEDEASVAKSTISKRSVQFVKNSASILTNKEEETTVVLEQGEEAVEMINEKIQEDAASAKSKKSTGSKKSIAASAKSVNGVLSKLEEHADEVLP